MAAAMISAELGGMDSIDSDNSLVDTDLLEIVKKWKGVSCNGNFKLTSLVEQLGPYITNKNQNIRLNGMSTLIDTISEIPNKFINTSEADHLISFFCNRLKDHHSIVPHVLKGILTLIQCENFPSGQATTIAKTIFQEVHVPSHLQADRYCIYNIIFKLLQRCLKELQSMGSDFVFNFIQVMDGERDPKCLLLALHTIPIIVLHFDLGVFTEDMFEVFSCYFPVDFNPPENDPIGITRTDLNIALQDCLLSTSKFSTYCFPLLLEKLDSDVLVAKLDSLHLLGLCFQKYSPESLQKFISPTILAICKETIGVKQDEVQNKLLETLTIIFHVASKHKTELGGQEILNELFNEVYKECEHLIQDCQSLLLYPANKILLVVSASTQDASNWLLSKVFPHFLNMFAVSTKVSDQNLILDVLSEFINATKQHASFEDENNPFKKHQESLLEVYFSSLTIGSEQLHSTVIKGLKAILSVKNMVLEKYINAIVEYILMAVTNNKSNIVRTDYADLLSCFAHHYPLIVKENIVSRLMQEILTASEGVDIIRLNKLLDLLVAASIHPTIMEIVVPKLTSHLTNFRNNNVVCCVVRSLLQISKNHIRHQSSVQYLYSSCVNIIIQHCFSMVLSVREYSEVYDAAVMDSIGLLVQIVVQQFDESSSLCLVELLTKNSMEELLLFGVGTTRVPLHCLPVNHQYIFAIVLRAVFGNVRREVYIPKNYVLAVAEESLKLQDEQTSLILIQCVSAVINKMINEEQLEWLVNTITKKLLTMIETEHEDQRKAIQMWIWITKAMLLRGYPATDHLVKQMISFLDHNTFGKLAADGFCTVLSEEPEILTSSCHANRRLLYKQHFFLMTLPQLLNGFNNLPEDQKANYMTAICHQLRFQDKPVLLSEFPLLLPIILQSLHSKDSQLLASVLSNLAEILDVASHLFENHVHALVPQLNELVSFEGSMNVRMMSLKCLKSVTNLSHHLILPLRQSVIKKVAGCLDDKKRLVRKEAVLTRCEWFLIGQPGKSK